MPIELTIVMLYSRTTAVKPAKQTLAEYVSGVEGFLISVVKLTLSNLNCLATHAFDHMANDICWRQCRKTQTSHFHIMSID